MDTSIRTPAQLAAEGDVKNKAYWLRRFDELALRYVRRPLNAIVRARFNQELRELRALAAHDDVEHVFDEALKLLQPGAE